MMYKIGKDILKSRAAFKAYSNIVGVDSIIDEGN